MLKCIKADGLSAIRKGKIDQSILTHNNRLSLNDGIQLETKPKIFAVKRVGVSHHCQFCLVLRWREKQAWKQIFERRKAPLEERNPFHGPLRLHQGKTYTHTPDRAIPGPFF